MSFDKFIPAEIAEYKIYNVDSTEELTKVASEVDFPEGFVYDPDFLYMWIRIVSAGEFYGPNKNADYFPEAELIDYWETFREAHPFKNHENKKIENAIGKIISVRWNPVMKCVELLKAIDKKRSPEIARGYLKGYLTDVSMGCKVPYTECSICGNKARKRSEFCDHVKFYRNKMLGNGERVFEINYKPKFHDSSTVLNGAERVAKAFYIFDSPPENTIVSSFRKAASHDGKSTHFIRLSDYEMEKVAEAKQAIHPLLQDPVIEKSAADSPMMRKIAELEKELTGKLLNIVSVPDEEKVPAYQQMLEIIKFLTEKRMDEESLENLATSVREVAEENEVPLTRAFTTLIGVAELLGIEFFPAELHSLLRGLTDAKLNDSLEFGTSQTDKVFPGDYVKEMNRAVNLTRSTKTFQDPSSLLTLYNEAAHHTPDFLDGPLSFLSKLDDHHEIDERPPVRMIRIIKKSLDPIAPLRSYHPEHLYPRLSIVLSGNRPILGSHEVSRDLRMLSHPETAGDLLGGIAYGIYEKLRPQLMGTRLVKVAAESDAGLSKVADSRVERNVPKPTRKELKAQAAREMAMKVAPGASRAKRNAPPPRSPKGVKGWQLALASVPAAYGISAYQKSKRDNGRYLSDGQNFMADHPGLVATGGVLAGKPLARAIQRTGAKINDTKEVIKTPFVKISNLSALEGLVKVADSFESGNFNVFDDREVMKTYMKETGATADIASGVKLATILSIGGLDKEAKEIMYHYNIPDQEKGRLLKIALEYMDGEMSKVAEDFTNNMILSAIGDASPLARSLPGRAVDAFVFKKLGDIGKPADDKTKKLKAKPDIEDNSPKPWTESYRQGPALQTKGDG